jgi:lipid-binding SYLF domain-containing protein
MRKVFTAGILCLFASSALATLSKDEAKRLNQAAQVLTGFRSSSDKGVPEPTWAKAQCVIVVPSLKKGAFVVGGEYGAGVMNCRTAHDWSPPVFMKLEKGSFGLQIGGEEVNFILLVMNRKGVDKMLEDKVTLGGDAAVAAGPVGATGSAETDALLHAEILAYSSQAKGAFAGIDLSGGVLKPDKDADARAYGEGVSARDVVTGTKQVAPPPEAADLMRVLRTEGRATSGKK